MSNYKGYDIPDTIEEILEKETDLRNPQNPMVPTLSYQLDDKFVSIPVSLEDMTALSNGTDEDKKRITDVYVDTVKKFIDNIV